MIIGHTTKQGNLISSLKPCSEQKVCAKCDRCNKDLNIIYANYNNSQKRRNYDGLTFCRSCTSKQNGINRKGKYISRKKGKFISADQRKRKNYISSDGYNMVFDPSSYKEDLIKNKAYKGYRKEHILVMENFLGRKLTKDEQVHHIDGNKLNNNLNNLIIVTPIEHKIIHYNLMKIAYELIKQNKIFFDRNNKNYVINEDNYGK